MSSPPTPKTSFTPPSFAKLPSNEPPGRIPCTFASCKFFFQNTAAMKRHKSTAPDHEYCEKCDLDCETEDQLLIHKIKSNKHIVCPVCGIEFGSEGGRDRHIRLNHRTAQNLTCPGCNDTFRSAAGMVRHVENGDCTTISQKRLLLEQSKKLMRKEALEIAEACMAASMTPSIVDVDEDGDGDGGVVLPMTIGESNREAMANQPGGVSGSLIDDHWPGLPGTEETGLDDIMGVMALKDAAKKTAKDSDKENERWKGKGREHSGASGAGSGSAGGSVSASSVGAPSGSIGPPDMALVLRRIYKDFDAANFLDGFTGEYVCPCGRRCSTKEGFEKHVLAKSQGSRRMECPGCLRPFNSTSALVAHWESATLRCDIKDGNSYGQIMDEVSGGLVQIAGFNDDGTVKYEAGKLELQKKITVGVDLDKFGW